MNYKPDNQTYMSFEFLEDTELVNRKLPLDLMFSVIPTSFLILALNGSVLMKLWDCERTTVNQLMRLDSMVNMFLMCLCTFQLSPPFIGLGSHLYCAAHQALYTASALFNRLVPVAIVMFR